MLSCRLKVSVAALVFCQAATGQVAWRSLSGPDPRTGAMIAYDAARAEAVLFGGTVAGGWSDETWVFDGASWRPRPLATRPPARAEGAMAYDPIRQRVVLFGGGNVRGIGGNYLGLNDTWEWDGTSWTRRLPAVSPGPRAQHAMAFDPVRGRVLMLGGMREGAVYAGDVWEWDGTAWAAVPGTHPSLSYTRQLLVTDTARQTVAFVSGGAFWEWNGTRWTQLATPPPTVSGELSAVYDSTRRRLQVIGAGSAQDELWEWDGQVWARTSVMPDSRRNPPCAYDAARRQTVVCGAPSRNPVATDPPRTFLFDGTTWRTAPFLQTPGLRIGAAVAADPARRRVVLFGGELASVFNDELWEWDGASWQRIAAPGGPTPRTKAMLAYDPRKQRLVLFGGADNTWWRNDTWEWTGSQWVARAPTTSPLQRSNAGMCFDPQRGGILLFGGEPYGVVPNETWEWDGTNWKNLAPANAPSARYGMAMAADEDRGVVVLFGGRTSTVAGLDDTWEWTAGNWVQRSPVHKPSPRTDAKSVYDPLRRRIVLHGGMGSGGYYSDTWEWDGVDWTLRDPALDGARTEGHLLAFDHARDKVLLLKANVGAHWEYGPVTPATATPLGAGCSGTGGPAILEALSLPWIGDRMGVHYQPAIGGRPALLLLGTSRAQFGGLRLPLDLGPLGMPGCALFTSAEIALGFPSPLLDLPVPGDPGLVGTTFYLQALIRDPAANALGTISSNSLAAVVGSR